MKFLLEPKHEPQRTFCSLADSTAYSLCTTTRLFYCQIVWTQHIFRTQHIFLAGAQTSLTSSHKFKAETLFQTNMTGQVVKVSKSKFVCLGVELRPWQETVTWPSNQWLKHFLHQWKLLSITALSFTHVNYWSQLCDHWENTRLMRNNANMFWLVTHHSITHLHRWQ